MSQDILDYNLLKLNSQINRQWKYSFVVYVQYYSITVLHCHIILSSLKNPVGDKKGKVSILDLFYNNKVKYETANIQFSHTFSGPFIRCTCKI